MRRILCFGDSNTYGHDPVSGSRFDENHRWTMVLQRLLGSKYKIIEEGLSGRTTVWDSPMDRGLRGDLYLWPCLQSHSPLDLVVIMLGTNDCKSRFSRDPLKIAEGMETIINIVKNKELWGDKAEIPKLLIVSPVLITMDLHDNEEMCNEFGKESVEISSTLPPLYKALAQKYNVNYLDAEEYISASRLDGVHIEKEDGEMLAEEIANFVQALFKQT